MNQSGFIRIGAAGFAAASALIAASSPARAEWRRAESPKFIVYGEARPSALTEFTRTLETFDIVLRTFLSVPLDEAPPRKLPVYVVSGQRDLRTVSPAMGRDVAGYYVPTEEDIFAIAWRPGMGAGSEVGDLILLHEYGHHFMLQHFPYGYPAWFVEGFAEYFASTKIEGSRVQVGLIDPNRAYGLLNTRWLPITDLLTKSPGQIPRGDQSYYPLAGILTHWFLSEEGRRPQLGAYLRDVSRGVDPVEALETHTGLTPEGLERELRAYVRGRVGYRQLRIERPEVSVAVTALPASAEDLILLGQRVKLVGHGAEEPELLAQVRTAAEGHGDAFAMKILANAEMKLGDRVTAESLLRAVLDQTPDDVEALQLIARLRLDQARDQDDPAAADALRGQARGFLARAYQLDDANFRTFYLLAESRRTAANYPTDNDIETLRLAYDLAPQLAGARFNLAATLIYAGRKDEGIALLAPLVNDPHRAGMAAAARAMIADAQSGADSRAVLEAAEAAEQIEPEGASPEPAPPAEPAPPPGA